MAGEQAKKRKKNAPDKPQPAWLFPPQEENPVLNPKPVSEDQIRKVETERQNAIDFLKRRAYGVPDRPPPDPQLLNLIAVFLTEYGFSSTCRMFTTERNGRKTLNGWADELGGKLKPGTPRLAKIYKDWLKEWEERRELDMTSDEDDDAATKREKMVERRANPKAKKTKVEDEQTSSSGSESSSDEASEGDVEIQDASPTQGGKQAKRAASGTSSSASSRSSSSESDADDEKETKAVKAPSPKPTVNGLVNKLKRKATSDSTDKAGTEEEPSVLKKAKLDVTSDKIKADKKAGTDKKAKADKGEKKVKAKKNDTEAAAEEPADNAKPTKAEKKAKKAKKTKETDVSTNKEMSSTPAVAAPVVESSPEKPALDFVDNATQKTLPASSSDIPPKQPKSTKSTKKSTADSTSATAVTKDSKRKTSTDSSATLETNEPKKASSASSSSSPSSSSSDSDSDSDSASTPPPAKTKQKKSKSKSKSEPSAPTNDTTTDADPTPNSKSSKNPKKQNTPFSRIPTTTAIDPRVASNAYVPYDYAERAHRDLIVTKGKEFTKEKNKKKRGSYRGGMIDVEGRKGVKFEE